MISSSLLFHELTYEKRKNAREEKRHMWGGHSRNASSVFCCVAGFVIEIFPGRRDRKREVDRQTKLEFAFSRERQREERGEKERGRERGRERNEKGDKLNFLFWPLAFETGGQFCKIMVLFIKERLLLELFYHATSYTQNSPWGMSWGSSSSTWSSPSARPWGRPWAAPSPSPGSAAAATPRPEIEERNQIDLGGLPLYLEFCSRER